MDKKHFLLSDVARILRLKPHRINYVLATRQISEPTLRVANKRLFTEDDVLGLARHFHVSPNWPAAETPIEDQGHRPPLEGLALRPPFEVESTGETCHEVRDGDGAVFAWTGDRARALILAGLLESAVRG